MLVKFIVLKLIVILGCSDAMITTDSQSPTASANSQSLTADSSPARVLTPRPFRAGELPPDPLESSSSSTFVSPLPPPSYVPSATLPPPPSSPLPPPPRSGSRSPPPPTPTLDEDPLVRPPPRRRRPGSRPSSPIPAETTLSSPPPVLMHPVPRRMSSVSSLSSAADTFDVSDSSSRPSSNLAGSLSTPATSAAGSPASFQSQSRVAQWDANGRLGTPPPNERPLSIVTDFGGLFASPDAASDALPWDSSSTLSPTNPPTPTSPTHDQEHHNDSDVNSEHLFEPSKMFDEDVPRPASFSMGQRKQSNGSFGPRDPPPKKPKRVYPEYPSTPIENFKVTDIQPDTLPPPTGPGTRRILPDPRTAHLHPKLAAMEKLPDSTTVIEESRRLPAWYVCNNITQI